MLSVYFYCPDCKFEWEIQYARFVNKKVLDLKATVDVLSRWYQLNNTGLTIIKTFSKTPIVTTCTVCQCRNKTFKGVQKNVMIDYSKLVRKEKQKTG